MGLKLSQSKKLGLDTNAFIYRFGKVVVYKSFTDRLFQLLDKKDVCFFVSTVVWLELLATKKVIDNPKILGEYQKFMTAAKNLFFVPVSLEIAEQVARLRVQYHLRTPDAIHIATAIASNCDIFISNDKKLKKIKEIKVVLISEQV